MKLKKFIKNKKLKTVFVGSIVGILLVIGGISLYRTFALYEEEETFDVLNGTVPDFVYKENILNGADPVLKSSTGAKLIPVQIDDTGKVTKADIKDKWYSYAEKKWANAVILVDNTKEYKNDEVIPEENIESYFVWIPKYKYKIFDMGNTYTTVEKEGKELEDKSQIIEIKFDTKNTEDNKEGECATPNASGEDGTCDVNDWMTHPAFLAFPDSKGFWVGKFETGYNQSAAENLKTIDTTGWTTIGAQKNTNEPTKVIIKPNVYSWRNIMIGNIFKTSYEYKRNFESHMMKNTEWGAIAYLTQSKYGRCTDNICVETTPNANISYTTGMEDIATAYPNSKEASTTGNNTGIFDMSGGAWEALAGVVTSAMTKEGLGLDSIQFESSGLTTEDIIDLKYVDLYLAGEKTQFNGRILGDATGEMGPFFESPDHWASSWYEDWAQFLSNTSHWFNRGCMYLDGSGRGLFAYGPFDGTGKNYVTFRIVLTLQT